MSIKKTALIGFGGLLALVAIIWGIALGYQWYKVFSKEKDGEAKLAEAKLAEAKHERLTLIETAEAQRESAKYHAEAEVERAKGVAEANRIIGQSLENNDAYLRYLWIQGLHNGSSETIYIPTEANLPILEAQRLQLGGKREQ